MTHHVTAAERLAQALLVGFSKADLEGWPLTQLQQIDLLSSALQCFDGIEMEMKGLAEVDELLRGGLS